MNTFSSPAPSADPLLLTIAGHDPSNGAGITADLQTFAAHRLFGVSVITALTVQSTLGVAEVHPVRPDLLRRTLQHLCADLSPSGIKIGMLGSTDNASVAASFLASLTLASPTSNGTGRSLPIVLDPVIRSSSGADLLPSEAVAVLHQRLIPSVTWITPNWAELSALTAQPIRDAAQAEAAADLLGFQHPHLHIVATAGGHSPPIDILRLPSGEIHRFPGEHIETSATHGTGCAFSAALLSRLVLGDSPAQAVHSAKLFVTEAIRRAPRLGRGTGPLNLTWCLT